MGGDDYRSDLVLWLRNQFQCELEIADNLKGTSYQMFPKQLIVECAFY